MAEPAYRQYFYQDEHDWFIQITTTIEVEDEEEPIEIIISDEDIEDGSWEEYESISDSQSLTFQNCRSSYIQFTTKYIDYSLYGQWLEVNRIIVIDEEQEEYLVIPMGYFYVAEDNLSRDGITQDIVAYDSLYFVISCPIEDATNIYRRLRSADISVKDFRDNFFYVEFGIEQENVSLINDDIILPAIQVGQDEYISSEDTTKMIAEINGVFPHVGTDGLLHWISPDVGDINEKGLYPGFYPSENTYPGTGYHGEFFHIYKDMYVEDSVVWANYETLKPDGVQIRNENNEIVYFANSANSVNPYTVINNFLIYGLSYGQCQQIAERLYEKIKLFAYVPFEMMKMGDLCVNVGDRVMVHTQESGAFVSYIFNKHTTGIENPFEDIQTSGTYDLSQYDVSTNQIASQVKNLDNRIGNIEKSGSGPLQIVSVSALPDNPQLNVLYLIQGEVTVS